MKLRHAAALVGWYLMVPPQQRTQAMQRYSAYMNSHRAAPMGTATPVGEDKVSKREVPGATISAWGKWGSTSNRGYFKCTTATRLPNQASVPMVCLQRL